MRDVWCQRLAVLRSRELEAAGGRKSASPADMVVEEESEPDLPSRPESRHMGQDKLHRSHQVRRNRQQAFPLREGFADESELIPLEVTQSAVDQFRAGRRGRGTQIRLFDERNVEAAAGGITGNAGAVDTTADDEEVDVIVVHGR
jgi:hypothetical protein